jgi:hypothetical protein
MGDQHVAALMAAYAVAMCARTRQLTSHEVEDMRVKAEELLLRDHPAYPIIMTFCTMYEVDRRDKDAVAALGEDLERGLRHAVWQPEHPMPERRDIDG